MNLDRILQTTEKVWLFIGTAVGIIGGLFSLPSGLQEIFSPEGFSMVETIATSAVSVVSLLIAFYQFVRQSVRVNEALTHTALSDERKRKLSWQYKANPFRTVKKLS